MASRLPPPPGGSRERRLAVIDMGSNTFRLVLYHYRRGGFYRLADEIRISVRISAGAGPRGLRPEAIERAGHAARLFAAFCAASDVDEVEAVATSAVRDAANGAEALEVLSAGGALPARVLSARQEARYGYLGAINTTTLENGYVLDLGGGSMQISRVVGRRLVDALSRPVGAVRMTESFLPGELASRSELRALRRHVLELLDDVPWLERAGGRVVGIGGTVRTLARMAQRRDGYPLDELHSYPLTRESLADLVETMARTPAPERSRLPGLKQDRADITLAGAAVVEAAMNVLGAPEIEVCSYGLREGLLFERFLAPADPPLIGDVRHQSVLNLMDSFRVDAPHVDQVATVALELYEGLAQLRLLAPDANERELLWSAAMLHDSGVAIDYNDHHKHGYYLVLNAGLPGFRQRDLALVALLVRHHRKALPSPDPLAEVVGEQGERSLLRMAVCLRIAEQLARARGVHGVRVERDGDALRVLVDADGDPDVAIWSAGQESPAIDKAFGLRLEVLPDETAAA